VPLHNGTIVTVTGVVTGAATYKGFWLQDTDTVGTTTRVVFQIVVKPPKLHTKLTPKHPIRYLPVSDARHVNTSSTAARTFVVNAIL
jgi:hypothetical protein